ncbi:Zn-ribbon domain-containing OB-fold protein [Nocardioides sp.]|uniref:Zn-ribbon domain-containing OB-fold protein n=1 Tax=Nocardioides sp. TaxID=35761 RepID=UPI003D11B58C
MNPTNLPMPDIDDPLTAEFWAAARDRRLVLPRCANCGYLEWPPEKVCPECQHTERTWQEHPAEGTLWSYAVYHRALDPAFADLIPYVVGLVELDAGPKFYGLMQDGEDTVRIGQRVVGVFEQASELVTFLRWKVVDDIADHPLSV